MKCEYSAIRLSIMINISRSSDRSKKYDKDLFLNHHLHQTKCLIKFDSFYLELYLILILLSKYNILLIS